MSKVGKILGVVAGLAALTFAAPFAGLAIGGVAIGGTSGIAARLLTTVAASALMSVSRKGVSAGGGGGITLASTMSGEQQPESIILGRTATGGSAVCPPMSHGDKHSYLTHVVELCSAPGATLERLILNGAYVELGSTPHPDYGRPVLGDYEGLVWVRYYDGSQTTADPMLRAKYGSHPDRPWTAAMVGRGICYAILTFKLDRERLTSVPSYRFQMRGIPLYDPRRDSTAGGSGPQRWTDPSTWEQTDNPIVMVHALKRGIPLPGGEVYGGKIAAADLPAATWFAAMNECDLAVPRQGGGTERQYRAGLEIQLSEQPAAAIEELLKAAAAEVADVGGIWKVRVGGPGLPVFAITDESLIVTREQDYDPFPGLSEAYNAVTATYPDPEALWESRDAPARTSAELEAQDRFGRKSAALTLPAVPYGLQVQRLMRAWLEDQRRFRKHTGVLPPSGCGLEPLDVVAWTSARNGYEAKLFSLEQVADEPVTCLQGLVAREVDPDDYSWEPGYELPTSIPAPGLTPAAPVVLPDWQCEGITLRDGAGKARRPALKCSWDGEFSRARSIKWEARLAGATEASLRGTTDDVEAGALIIAAGILPAQGYETRGFPNLHNGRGTWSLWMPAVTPDVRLSDGDVYLPGQVDEVLDALDENLHWIRDGSRELIEGMRRNILTQAEIDARHYTDRQTMRRELASTREGVIAGYQEEITVATGPNSALAQRIEQVNGRVGDVTAEYKAAITVAVGPNSAIAQELRSLDAAIDEVSAGYQEAITVATGPNSALSQRLEELEAEITGPDGGVAQAIEAVDAKADTINGRVTTEANRITALTTRVDRSTADAYLRARVEATPSGAESRIGLYASATAGEGTGREAALFLEARSGGKSRVLIQADQFAIVNEDARAFPFIFEGGVARLQAAMIGDLTVGRIKIAAGAVSATFSADGANSNSVPGNGIDSYSTVLTLTVPVDEPAMMIYGIWYRAVADSGLLRGRATRNGVVIVGSDATPASGASEVGAFVRAVDVGSGTQTIRIQGSAYSTTDNPRILYPSIFAFVAYR